MKRKTKIVLGIIVLLTNSVLFKAACKTTQKDSTTFATKLFMTIPSNFEVDTVIYDEHSKVLHFVMTWEKLYFPFGKHSTVTSLKKSFSKTAIFKTQIKKSDGYRYYSFTDSGIQAEFVYDNPRTEKKYFEVTKAKVQTPNITLCRSIKIGMSLRDFIHIFSPKFDDKDLSNIDMIELETTVFAVLMKCKFEHGVLKVITVN